MPDHIFSRIFERERQEQEAYAKEHGYTVESQAPAKMRPETHYVYQQGSPFPMCQCVLREQAIRIAYALAKAFPKTEGAP